MQRTSVQRHECLVTLIAGVLALGIPSFGACASWVMSQHVPAPPDNVPNDDRIALGRLLFFDTRLSAKQTMSCASCHNPALGWSDGLERAVGFNMKQLGRAT